MFVLAKKHRKRGRGGELEEIDPTVRQAPDLGSFNSRGGDVTGMP